MCILLLLDNQPRSCKRSHTSFQKSILLFSTWREYFYSQPPHFSSQPKKKGFKQSFAPFTRPCNQFYFILNTIIWCKFWRKMFLYLCKYSYKANMWIFTWNSKHTSSFWKEKFGKRKMKQSMSPSCPFSWFSFKFSW